MIMAKIKPKIRCSMRLIIPSFEQRLEGKKIIIQKVKRKKTETMNSQEVLFPLRLLKRFPLYLVRFYYYP